MKFKIEDIGVKDAGKGFARISSTIMHEIGIEPLDVVEIYGKRKSAIRIMPASDSAQYLITGAQVERGKAVATFGSTLARQLSRCTVRLRMHALEHAEDYGVQVRKCARASVHGCGHTLACAHTCMPPGRAAPMPHAHCSRFPSPLLRPLTAVRSRACTHTVQRLMSFCKMC